MNAIEKVVGDTIFALLVVTTIAGLIYVVRHQRITGFGRFLGLLPISGRLCAISAAAGVLFAFASWFSTDAILTVAIGPEAAEAWASSPNSTGNQLLATGATGLPLWVAACLKGVFQTALPEELLFRGLIGKRLVNRMGFRVGNMLQAAIFAGMHMSFPFLLNLDGALPMAIAFGLISGSLGWGVGYLNYRHGDGSMVPGWIVHGVANGITYVAMVM